MMPGGGVGIFNGCSSQWGAPANGWGGKKDIKVLKVFFVLKILRRVFIVN